MRRATAWRPRWNGCLRPPAERMRSAAAERAMYHKRCTISVRAAQCHERLALLMRCRAIHALSGRAVTR